MKKIFSMLSALMFIFSGDGLHAETLSFPAVWKQVERASHLQEGARLRTEATKAARKRAGLHWLPRVYLDGRTYLTNDPGQTFFGLLEQRAATAGDFDPAILNHPGSKTFVRGALGAEWALYEGGMKQNQVSFYDHSVQADDLEGRHYAVEEYAQAALAYGSLVSVQKQTLRLEHLNGQLLTLMKNYKLGQQNNPVGYSGLLGMKSLSNRVAGLIEALSAQKNAYISVLKEMGVTSSGWSTDPSMDPISFIDQHLRSDSKEGDSFKIASGDESARSMEAAAKMEKARYLPRVAAFAESYAFNGHRDLSGGYTTGLYLQWSLYDPSNDGRYKEARTQALAVEKFNEAHRQKERAEKSMFLELDKALRANLVRLEESGKLLEEQHRVSATLFRNGSISALQFVEILNRRTDLISQQSEAELELMKTSAALVTTYTFQIPNIPSSGENT